MHYTQKVNGVAFMPYAFQGRNKMALLSRHTNDLY